MGDCAGLVEGALLGVSSSCGSSDVASMLVAMQQQQEQMQKQMLQQQQFMQQQMLQQQQALQQQQLQQQQQVETTPALLSSIQSLRSDQEEQRRAA